MKKRRFIEVVVVFSLFCLTSPVYAANDNLTVNTGTVLNTVPSPWLGVNYVAFWDSIQGSTASR
ncbi:MAG: hypothetical protein IMZ61_01785, partial [Planctomycetes bacterium]|nr:hypothetical protein [Planctomycetota bacterium]